MAGFTTQFAQRIFRYLKGHPELIGGASAASYQDDLTAAVTASGGQTIFLEGGKTYTVDSDLALPSGTRLESIGGVATIDGSGSIKIQGTAAGNTSDLSANAIRGDKTVTVVDGSQFSVGDDVEIVASPDEDDNSSKLVPAELNEVTGIAVNVLTLKYPLSHAYTTGFATEPNVTVVDSLIENVSVSGVKFTGGPLLIEYAQHVDIKAQFDTASFGNGTVDGAIRDLQLDIRTRRDAGAASGANAEVFLYNAAQFEATIHTFGGFKDSVRMRGCADGTARVWAIEAASRGVWMYKCDKVDCWPTVIGSQAVVANTEHTIFDYCYDCTFHDIYAFEPNKTNSECGEFRGDSSFCRYEGGHVFPAYTIVFEWKAGAANNVINGVSCHIDDDANRHFVSLQAGTPIADFHALTITNCHMVRTGTGIAGNQFFFLRTSSDTNFATNQIDLIRVAGCTLDRDNGSIISLGGTGAGTKVKKLVVENNRCAGGVATDGDLIVVTGIPVEKMYAIGNSLHTSNIARDIRTTVVDDLYLDANYGITYDITNETTLVIDGLGVESANAETPTAANWRPGQVVDFTDSGDATGNGLYMLDHDATTWHNLTATGSGGFSDVSKNSGATINAADRTTLNFIEGTGITLTIADDAGGDEVDITVTATGGGGGEANTASNIGAAGVGVYDSKSGVDLRFRNINAGSSKVTVTDDTANDEIDIDVVEANINHDSLSGFVANEHLDWTGDQGANNIHVNNITAVPESAVTAHEAAIDHDALTNFVANEHATPKNSVEIDVGQLQLDGDAASPGNSKLYGTNASGVKGWYDQPGGGSVTIKSGTVAITEGTGATVTFGTAFVGSVPRVVVTAFDSSGRDWATHISSVTSASFFCDGNDNQGGGAGSANFHWIATDAGDP